MNCKVCGNAVNDYEAVCSMCGNDMEAQRREATEPVPSLSQEKNDAINRILYDDDGLNASERLQERRKKRQAERASSHTGLPSFFTRDRGETQEERSGADDSQKSTSQAEYEAESSDATEDSPKEKPLRKFTNDFIWGSRTKPEPEPEPIPEPEAITAPTSIEPEQQAFVVPPASAPEPQEPTTDQYFALSQTDEEQAKFEVDKKNEQFQELLDKEFERLKSREKPEILSQFETPEEIAPTIPQDDSKSYIQDRIDSFLKKSDDDLTVAMRGREVEPTQEFVAPSPEPKPEVTFADLDLFDMKEEQQVTSEPARAEETVQSEFAIPVTFDSLNDWTPVQEPAEKVEEISEIVEEPAVIEAEMPTEETVVPVQEPVQEEIAAPWDHTKTEAPTRENIGTFLDKSIDFPFDTADPLQEEALPEVAEEPVAFEAETQIEESVAAPVAFEEEAPVEESTSALVEEPVEEETETVSETPWSANEPVEVAEEVIPPVVVPTIPYETFGEWYTGKKDKETETVEEEEEEEVESVSETPWLASEPEKVEEETEAVSETSWNANEPVEVAEEVISPVVVPTIPYETFGEWYTGKKETETVEVEEEVESVTETPWGISEPEKVEEEVASVSETSWNASEPAKFEETAVPITMPWDISEPAKDEELIEETTEASTASYSTEDDVPFSLDDLMNDSLLSKPVAAEEVEESVSETSWGVSEPATEIAEETVAPAFDTPWSVGEPVKEEETEAPAFENPWSVSEPDKTEESTHSAFEAIAPVAAAVAVPVTLEAISNLSSDQDQATEIVEETAAPAFDTPWGASEAVNAEEEITQPEIAPIATDTFGDWFTKKEEATETVEETAAPAFDTPWGASESVNAEEETVQPEIAPIATDTFSDWITKKEEVTETVEETVAPAFETSWNTGEPAKAEETVAPAFETSWNTSEPVNVAEENIQPEIAPIATDTFGDWFTKKEEVTETVEETVAPAFETSWNTSEPEKVEEITEETTTLYSTEDDVPFSLDALTDDSLLSKPVVAEETPAPAFETPWGASEPAVVEETTAPAFETPWNASEPEKVEEEIIQPEVPVRPNVKMPFSFENLVNPPAKAETPVEPEVTPWDHTRNEAPTRENIGAFLDKSIDFPFDTKPAAKGPSAAPAFVAEPIETTPKTVDAPTWGETITQEQPTTPSAPIESAPIAPWETAAPAITAPTAPVETAAPKLDFVDIITGATGASVIAEVVNKVEHTERPEPVEKGDVASTSEPLYIPGVEFQTESLDNLSDNDKDGPPAFYKAYTQGIQIPTAEDIAKYEEGKSADQNGTIPDYLTAYDKETLGRSENSGDDKDDPFEIDEEKDHEAPKREALSIVISILIVILVVVIVCIIVLHFMPDSTGAHYIRDFVETIQSKFTGGNGA